MVLISGLLIICVAVAATIARRRSREREEAADTSRDAFQALMREDLHLFTSQGHPPDAPAVDEAALVRAFQEDSASDTDDAPLIHHDSKQERLFLFYDETEVRNPVVSVAPDRFDPTVTRVFMDGTLVAKVSSRRPVRAADVSTMPQSTAVALGLVPRAA